MTLHPWQHQIILGTLLGSGHILTRGGRCHLGMAETRDANWIAYKGAELSDLGARTPMLQCRGVWKWRGDANGPWAPYRDLHYESGLPRLSMGVLDQLRDIGHCVWFGDKGFWYSPRRVGLRAAKFATRAPALDYFSEVGLPCAERRKAIVFTPEGTRRFLEMIAHRLPDFMRYRLSATQSSE